LIKHGVVRILSLDGGGVRGLIAARVLEDLFRRIRMLRLMTHRRPATRAPHEVFDLFAGTSTGALIALSLVRPEPLDVRELADVYRHQAHRIFPVSRFSAVATMRQAFTEKYDAAPLEAAVTDMFGDTWLSETRSGVVVASYDTDNRAPFFFKHYPSEMVKRHAAIRRRAEEAEDFRLRDVARATTAAPTYFAPAQITSRSGKRFSLVDGGLVANNPALSAYVEARTIWPDARRYVIVSIGTGSSGRRYPYELIRKWGYIDWVSPIHGVPLMSMISDGQSESVAHALTRLPRVSYFRFNAEIHHVSEEMDDSRRENLDRVDAMAQQIIRTNHAEMHRLARMLYTVSG
jgi:patatin-like phospholipase/acyl hydrolase